MNRRAFAISLALSSLAPVTAWAGNCGDGSDTSGFADALNKHGVVVAILMSFGFGVLASLTPCVYPMVPITVSIFGATSQETSRLRGAGLSAAFVLGIAALFTPMGVASALTGRLMGSALSNQWVVLSLAALFVALAASMFGAFELALPSSLTTRLSSVGGVGFKGAFVMGMVMGLIAAPCTGPFLTGMVTVIATTKNVALGSAALFSFALGLGVVFFVAGAFGANLPKAGAWMMAVKWVSGVGLAYLAFAYLRDRFAAVRHLVEHPSYAFGAAAGALLVAGVALGLVHVLAERRKSPLAKFSRRARLASVAPAVLGAAMFFSWSRLSHEVVDPSVPEIQWMTDEAAAVAKARAEGKPLLVDFASEWCEPCKELDQHTFKHAAVRAEASRFVALRVEVTGEDEKEDIVKKYGVVGYPTVILLDADGHEAVRFNDKMEADALVSALRCHFPKKALADRTATRSSATL